MRLTGALDDKSIIIIAGPTASGKTDIGIRLARTLNGEIISADSRQVYRYLDIGTAKPTRTQQNAVRHHCVDFLDPDIVFDAGRFVSLAHSAIKNILRRKKQPIIVGGTGLYIKALMDGLAPLPPRNNALREKLIKSIEERGLEYVFKELEKKDPETARVIDKQNPARVIRAMEVFLLTGKSMVYLHKKTRKSSYSFDFLCCMPTKEVLLKRIEQRTDFMLASGMIQETQKLLQKGYAGSCPGLSGVGYRHVVSYINGEIDKNTLKQSIITDTWQYAKRQKTWFKKDKRIIPISGIGDVLYFLRFFQES